MHLGRMVPRLAGLACQAGLLGVLVVRSAAAAALAMPVASERFDGLVSTPAGLTDAACVHRLAPGTTLDLGRRLLRKGDASAPLPPSCAAPTWQPQTFAAPAGSSDAGTSRVLGSVWATAPHATWETFSHIDTRSVVPAHPTDYHWQDFLLYSGLEGSAHTANGREAVVMSSVLQYGVSPAGGTEGWWSLSAWVQVGSSFFTSSPVYTHAERNVRHLVTSDDGARWRIVASDLTAGTASAIEVESLGFQDLMDVANKAVFRASGIGETCKEMPASTPIWFTDVSVRAFGRQEPDVTSLVQWNSWSFGHPELDCDYQTSSPSAPSARFRFNNTWEAPPPPPPPPVPAAAIPVPASSPLSLGLVVLSIAVGVGARRALPRSVRQR